MNASKIHKGCNVLCVWRAETAFITDVVLSCSVFPHVVLIFFLMTLKQMDLVEACEYDSGEKSDLFKAPEPIIEEPMLAVDPLSQEDC